METKESAKGAWAVLVTTCGRKEYDKCSHCKLKTVLSVDTCSNEMRITILNRITCFALTNVEL